MLKYVVLFLNRQKRKGDCAHRCANQLVFVVGELLRLQEERIRLQGAVVKKVDQVRKALKADTQGLEHGDVVVCYLVVKFPFNVNKLSDEVRSQQHGQIAGVVDVLH